MSQPLLQQVLNQFASNNYQLNQLFYTKLQQLLKWFQLYDLMQLLSPIQKTIHSIYDLIQTNTLSEDYDQDCSQRDLSVLKQHLMSVDNSVVPRIMAECEAMQYQPYHRHILNLLRHDSYQNIVKRILVSMQPSAQRVEAVLLVGTFYLLHHETDLQTHITTYNSIIQHSLELLQAAQPTLHSLDKYAPHSNIANVHRCRVYVVGLGYVLKITLRLCEIVKVLTGQNNLSLKFTIFKRDIKRLLGEGKFKIQEENNNTVEMIKEVIKRKQKFNYKGVCKFCLRICNNQFGIHQGCSLLFKRQI